MILLDVSGSRYEMGRAYGREFRLAHGYGHKNFSRVHHVDRADYRQVVRLGVERSVYFRRYFPEFLEEMEGFAAGSGIPLDEVLLANAGLGWREKEVVRSAGPGERTPQLRGGGEDAACSNLVLPDSDRGPLGGGTQDDQPIQYFLRAQPPGCHRYIVMMWPGWVAACWGGMNARGLYISSSSCAPAIGPFTEKECPDELYYPRFLGVRAVLERCATTGEALDFLRRPEVMLQGNTVVVDSAGRCARIEKKCSVLYGIQQPPAGQGIACGNIYDFEREKLPEGARLKVFNEAACLRFETVDRAVREQAGRYTLDGLRQTLLGHEHDPAGGGSICNRSTSFAIIGIPREGRYLIAERVACQTGFEEVDVR